MVTATLKRIVYRFLRSFSESEDENSSKVGELKGEVDGLWWYKDSGEHVFGEFSMAVIQANNILEDCSQLESGPMSLGETGLQGTFVGIYDGHAGPEASRFITDHLFNNLKKFTSENQEISADVIKKTFLATDDEFLSLVKKQWETKPQIAAVGSCCLVGIICQGVLYVANAGDSRVVLGKYDEAANKVKAEQLSIEHNASEESVRDELRALHPDDPRIVVLKNSVWRVKGIIQVSRSIGDAYLKKAQFNREPLLPRFRLPEPFQKPILLAEPSVRVQNLDPEDRFIIFASDGLWDHLSNQEAVNIVHNCPREGIARTLIKFALQKAAKKQELRYSDLEMYNRGPRRQLHDDITVIVVFLDAHLMPNHGPLRGGPVVSIKGGRGIP